MSTSAPPAMYTPSEVAVMSDADLLDRFTKIFNLKTLLCKHCHTHTPRPLSCFAEAIRRRCTKHGLSNTTKIPKTCDMMLKINDRNNPLPTHNPKNNEETKIKKALLADGKSLSPEDYTGRKNKDGSPDKRSVDWKAYTLSHS